jgi:choline-sulfatase
MSRRPRPMRLLLALSCLGCALGCGTASEAPPASILLLTIDTLRPDYMSGNGYPLPTTPYLDALVAQGFYFEGALAPVPRTTPALGSLLTGAYPRTTGIRGLTDALADGVVTLGEEAGRRGYQSWAVVSNNVLSRRRRLDRGFDLYEVGHQAHAAATTTARALSALAAQDPERPFFGWVHYIDPHVPYDPGDPEVVDSFDPGYRGRYAERFGTMPGPGEPIRNFVPYPVDLGKRHAVHRNRLPARVNEHVRRLYAGDIRVLDREVERLVETVRAARPELLLIFTADHGESLGEHDFYFDHGDYVYNAGTRVPLAFVLPRSHALRGQGRCRGWVSLVDVLPTALELMGWEPSRALGRQLEGRSLVPCMRGEPLAGEPVFAESGHSYFPHLVKRRVRNDVAGRFRAVVLGRWKLIWTPFQSDEKAWELYDVEADPHETRNLYAADHPAVPALRAHLERFLARETGNAAPSPGPSAADREALRSLGYVE